MILLLLFGKVHFGLSIWLDFEASMEGEHNEGAYESAGEIRPLRF